MVEFTGKYPVEPELRLESGCSIRSKTSWQEVLAVLEDSAKEYARATGVKRMFNKAKEFIESKADTMERVTRVVPDVDYAKPIVGTLTFLLQAFQQTSKVREEVKTGIEKLKKNFSLVEDCIAMYSDKKKVVDAVMALHVTILKAIEDVIGYYTQHMLIKGLKALWDGKNYEKSLLQCLENISKDGNELIHEADIAHKQETHVMSGDVKQLSNDFKSMADYLVNIANKCVLHMVEDHKKAMEARLAEVIATHEKDKAKNEDYNRYLRRQLERKHADYEELQQKWEQQVSQAPRVVTRDDLLDFLVSSGIETVDIEYIISQRELIISRGHECTEQIMKSTQLRDWLVQANSKELLVHGKSEAEPISPVSFFCALLVRNLRGVEQFKSMAFFCGCHPYDDAGGARPMIMSLLAQLLQQQQFDLGFITHELASWMNEGDIGAFCFVFGKLLRQVKATESMFCVIDGINFYEGVGEDLLQETAYVLRFLLDLTKERGAVFKILVTSPSTTVDTQQAIKEEDCLALPQRDANSLGYSDMRFERQLHEGFEVEQR
ncbi:hypothetical protein PG995_000274 [Apiospora arundinis]